jgi:hypothetical protein
VIRLLLIPVGGTISALVAILLAHEPRGEPDAPQPPLFPAPTLPESSPPPEEGDEPPHEDAPTAEPMEFQLELGADGTFIDLEGRVSFASVEALAKKLGDVRHTLLLSNGEGVTEEALDAALAKLRDRYQVRKVYRAPEAPPAEGR